ncbi:probable ATP-dependent RNA helicase DDX52 [Seriola lalandi dorsalis]|uniref:Probable ATP-dependent RNA helicase DDX52 n=1 Tax=Seriola lalandi dorsalis TaxID=1841481 RepID=A0A3B4Y1L3_SERLL|nr:probable ATP-dependent RNA helicase DDX52 [Seriola lalandi dorsalis]XP_056252454.1 probable ATP-dependent RNA helicase DDX52 [Seriola aureovittata]
MDAFELFRKLGAGAKFDLKRFGQDAARFKVVRSHGGEASSDPLSAIDYFGTGPANGAQSRTTGLEEDVEDGGEEYEEGSESGDSSAGGKRKRKDEEREVTTKKQKKKTKRNQVEAGGTEGNGISWTSSLDRKIQNLPSEGKDKNSLKRLKHLHQEKVNRTRSQHRINVHGCDVPDPVCTFEELQSEYRLNPRVLQNLKDAGLNSPTPIQMQAIPLMMHGRELLACAPTGSGKTLAFCLPLLAHLQQPANRGFRAVVISPTRELASQTYRELLRLSEGVGFRVHIIDKASLAAKKYGPQSNKKYDILVSTPNRLIFLLKQDPPALDLSSVEWLVVDESDKLFEAGKTGFREQLATVFLACSGSKVRRAFFSATCTQDVEQWCRLNLDNLVSVNIGHRNTAVETVEQELLFVGTENGKLVAMRDIIKKGFLPPMLVFVQSIERARELFHELVYEGINVDVIHADRTQQQRDNVVNSFRSGKIWVLICTALLARGIDFKGVNLVLNYDFPTSAVEYIHRIGRTGRAGHQGKAITFFTENDKPLLRSIANVIKQAGCPVPDYMIGFKKIHSKAKRRLEKKPPKRSTICTTPRFLMKKKGKAQGQKQAAGGEQQGEKKTKEQGLKKRNKTQKEEGTDKHKKTSQKTGSNSSGAKLKKKKGEEK